MTATDLHARALALIAERRALIAAGTPGPWTANQPEESRHQDTRHQDSRTQGIAP